MEETELRWPLFLFRKIHIWIYYSFSTDKKRHICSCYDVRDFVYPLIQLIAYQCSRPMRARLLCIWSCNSSTDNFYLFHPSHRSTKYRFHVVWLFLLLNSRKPCVTIPIVTNTLCDGDNEDLFSEKYERNSWILNRGMHVNCARALNGLKFLWKFILILCDNSPSRRIYSR